MAGPNLIINVLNQNLRLNENLYNYRFKFIGIEERTCHWPSLLQDQTWQSRALLKNSCKAWKCSLWSDTGGSLINGNCCCNIFEKKLGLKLQQRLELQWQCEKIFLEVYVELIATALPKQLWVPKRSFRRNCFLSSAHPSPT